MKYFDVRTQARTVPLVVDKMDKVVKNFGHVRADDVTITEAPIFLVWYCQDIESLDQRWLGSNMTSPVAYSEFCVNVVC